MDGKLILCAFLLLFSSKALCVVFSDPTGKLSSTDIDLVVAENVRLPV